MDVGHVQDQAARRAEVRSGGLRQEQGRTQVGADEVVELCRGDRADRRRIEARRIVDEDVEAPEACAGVAGELRDRVEVREVGAERGRRARPDLLATSVSASAADER
jgi:hypothetical protein